MLFERDGMGMMIYAILSVENRQEELEELLKSLKGVLESELYNVSLDEISIVAGGIERAELIADKSTAIAYAVVIETLEQHFTLLPVRFGSVMKSSEAICNMIKINYHDIMANLREVENKCEFGLKVFCDPEKLKAGILAKSLADVPSPDKADPGIRSSVYRDWVSRKLAEHRLEELMLNHVDTVITEITGRLNLLNAINKFKKMVTETTIIDAVFLLHKTQQETLISAVSGLQSQYPGLKFVLTGPWPPYNFVELTIK